jgi:hypothetical protein
MKFTIHVFTKCLAVHIDWRTPLVRVRKWLGIKWVGFLGLESGWGFNRGGLVRVREWLGIEQDWAC